MKSNLLSLVMYWHIKSGKEASDAYLDQVVGEKKTYCKAGCWMMPWLGKMMNNW